MKRLLSALIIAAAAFVACQKEETPAEEAAAPVLVNTSPADGATGISGTTLDAVFTYDQNIKCTAEGQKGIKAEGGCTISKINAYGTALTVSLSGLEPGKTYTLSIAGGSVQGYKENQKAAAAATLTFTMKEKDPDPEPAKHYELNPTATLANKNATKEAVKVYEYLLSQSGKKTLSGVQSQDTANNNEYLNTIYTRTGKHPAIAGYDFIFEHYSPTPASWSWKIDYSDMSAPIEHWQKNGLVSYMWHWNVPTNEAAYIAGRDNADFSGWNFYSDKTKFDIRELLKEGTWQHEYAIAEMDKVAGYLKILKDNNVPVLWRPFHEASGNIYSIWKGNAWFWWGYYGAEYCKQLWKLMYDRFTSVHGLDNLIWVWTIDYTAGAEADALEWYPGDDCVDIVGCDIYADDTNAKHAWWQFLVDVTKGEKLVTVSECGNIPSPDKCFEAGDAWSWFLVWSDDYALNTDEYWKSVTGSAKVLNRENLPSLK